MKIQLNKGLVIVLLFGLAACTSSEIADSKDVSQSQIYQKYYATWDAEDQSTYVEAVFRFGGSKGTSLILSEPSSITVNGKDLHGDSKFLRGYVYGSSSLKFDIEKIQFAFTNTENIRYKNTYSIVAVGIKSIADSFYKNNNLHFEIDGEPLATNEEFVLIIKDSKGMEAIFNTDVIGTESIYVESSSLSELSPGLVNIQISRIFQEDLKDCPEIGGFAEIRYLSKIYTSRISYQQISNI